MTKFIQSEKFFMPIIYIGFGIIIYLIIAKIIDDLSKINIKHVVGKGSGIDKRKKTVINLFKNIMKLLEDHKNGVRDNYRKIWAIYSFLKWYEVFFLEENTSKE